MDTKEISGKISDIKQSLQFLTHKINSASSPDLRKSLPAVLPKKSAPPDMLMSTPHFPLSLKAHGQMEDPQYLREIIQQKEQLLIDMSNVQNELYQTLADYKRTISALKYENEQQSRAFQTQLYEKDTEISFLKARLSSSNYPGSTADIIVDETMSLLQISQPTEVVPTVAYIIEQCRSLAMHEKFTQNLTRFISDISQTEYNQKNLELRDVWKYVITMFEKYMKLKRIQEQEQETSAVLKQLMACLGLRWPEDLLRLKEKLAKYN